MLSDEQREAIELSITLFTLTAKAQLESTVRGGHKATVETLRSILAQDEASVSVESEVWTSDNTKKVRGVHEGLSAKLRNYINGLSVGDRIQITLTKLGPASLKPPVKFNCRLCSVEVDHEQSCGIDLCDICMFVRHMHG